MVQLLTLSETQTALRLSKSSVAKLVKSGGIGTVLIGRRRLIPLSELERLATPTTERN